MPELPEVETVKNTLKTKVLNKIIKNCIVKHENIIENMDAKQFIEKIKNQEIKDITRLGKWLIFELSDYYLLSHLRMEGKYFIRQNYEDLNHVHVIFELNDTNLLYQDVRKFGKMHLLKKEDLLKVKPLSELGLEPWDKNLDVNYLKEAYKNKKLPIKTVILDQSIITGIGNIYADEILFLSKINPLTKAIDLKEKDLENIIKYTKQTLEKAINEGGTTIRSYTSQEGVHGRFQQSLYVHGKKDELCSICNTKINKIKVGGRGTYYCTKCQKECK